MSVDIATMIKQLPAVLRDPSDTMAGMTFYKAAGGRAISEALVAHLESTTEGQRLLKQKPDIYTALTNREKLRALPANTLGNHYITWADKEGIYPEGLATMGHALGILSDPQDETLAFLERRQQVTHDLYHVLTGYDRDTAGEMALLRFSGIQERNIALHIISWLGQLIFIFRGRFDLFKLRRDAAERARRAPLLIVQDWERLLELPIDDVRKQLNLYPAPQYIPLR